METKMRPVVELLKDSWLVFTKVWVKYLWLYLVLLVGMMLAFAVLVFGIFAGVAVNFNDISANPAVLSKALPIILVGLVFAIIYGAFVGLAINKLIYSEAQGQPVNVKEAFSYSWNNFFHFLWVSVLTGLIVLFGFVLLVVPGFYALTVLSLVTAVFVIEGKYSVEALNRSRDLVRGYFWPVFGRLVVLGVISAIISGLSRNFALVSYVLNFAFTVVSVAYVYFIYKNLAEIKK